LAGGGSCAAVVRVRSRPSVRGRPAPRSRHRGSDRKPRSRPRRGSRHVRRHGADRRKDRLHPVAVGLHRDAGAPRRDRRRARRARRRGVRRRRRRPDRRRRHCGAVRLLRRPPDRRRAGLRRSVASLADADGAGCAARASRRSGIHSGVARGACGDAGEVELRRSSSRLGSGPSATGGRRRLRGKQRRSSRGNRADRGRRCGVGSSFRRACGGRPARAAHGLVRGTRVALVGAVAASGAHRRRRPSRSVRRDA